MCGIAGVYAYRPAAKPVDPEEISRIREYMASRGPDGAGTWLDVDGRAALAHRRLSIIDLSPQAAQPMISEDGKIVVTFNGEVYNFRELSARLTQRGYTFRTKSDTEVLLHLYRDKGEAMVDDLRGMFAFGIWDADRRSIFLARDPYGIKPLYYADDGQTIRFASQVKALLAGGAVSDRPDEAGWLGFYALGSVPEPYTSYKSIRALAAGHTLRIDDSGVRAPRQYFSVAETYRAAESDPASSGNSKLIQARCRTALLDSVRHHLVSDVPVGVFLSAGVDSSALTGLMRDTGQNNIQTITIGFREFEGRHDDEVALAGKVAEHYGTRHVARIVRREEFIRDLPKILAAMDQPTIDGINTWFASKAAREHGLKVAISGLGGDELFGGYPSFRDIPLCVGISGLVSVLPPMRAVLRQGLRWASRHSARLSPKVCGLFDYGATFSGAYLLRRALFLPEELREIVDRDLLSRGAKSLDLLAHIQAAASPLPRTRFAKVAALESSLYLRNQLLRDTDWASMAHSLEVRVPLVDRTLLQAIAPVTVAKKASRGKYLLAAAPAKPLPEIIVRRRKTGFTTPVGAWLERDDRVQQWKARPPLSAAGCPWARRWAYQVANA